MNESTMLKGPQNGHFLHMGQKALGLYPNNLLLKGLEPLSVKVKQMSRAQNISSHPMAINYLQC